MVGRGNCETKAYIFISTCYFLNHSGVSILWDVICQNIWVSLAAVNCSFLVCGVCLNDLWILELY